jgi:hypothetical protein
MNHRLWLSAAWFALGAVELSWALFCVFGGLLLGVTAAIQPEKELMWMLGGLSGVYFVLVIANLPIALLHLYAGYRIKAGDCLFVLIAAMSSALITTVLALYCSPLIWIVLVYSVVALADADFRRHLTEAAE